MSTHEDITLCYRAEEKVKELARSDALTELSNRFESKQRLEQCRAVSRRRIGKYAMLSPLRPFQSGQRHPWAPPWRQLLQEITVRIKAYTRESDTIARVGGDEFAIIQRVSYVPRDAIISRNA